MIIFVRQTTGTKLKRNETNSSNILTTSSCTSQLGTITVRVGVSDSVSIRARVWVRTRVRFALEDELTVNRLKWHHSMQNAIKYGDIGV